MMGCNRGCLEVLLPKVVGLGEDEKTLRLLHQTLLHGLYLRHLQSSTPDFIRYYCLHIYFILYKKIRYRYAYPSGECLSGKGSIRPACNTPVPSIGLFGAHWTINTNLKPHSMKNSNIKIWTTTKTGASSLHLSGMHSLLMGADAALPWGRSHPSLLFLIKELQAGKDLCYYAACKHSSTLTCVPDII